ncbi:MAG TPA: hypothetical protein VGK26_12030 [Thermoanaerobaculia bacterium]
MTLSGIAAALSAGCFSASLGATALAAPGPTPPAPTPASSPSSSSAASSGASQAEARTLFDKAVAALGGKEKIAAVRDVRTRGQVSAKTESGELNMSMETTMVFPDRLAQQVDGPYGRFAMIATPASAYILTDKGPKDLPTPMRDELLRQVTRTAFFLVQNADDPKFKLALGGGEETVGDVQTRALDVSYGGVSVRWFVDPASGRILRSSHDSISPAGKSVHIVSDFSDFKTADGVTLPYKIQVKTENEPDQAVVLEEIKINPGVDPGLFVRPAEPTGPAPAGPTPPAPVTPKPKA